jgi:hypothetical protein
MRKMTFVNTQDMAIGCICTLFISPELFHQVYEESQESTPNELWTRLEVLFGNKEYFMQEVEQIEQKRSHNKIKHFILKSLLHKYLDKFVFH